MRFYIVTGRRLFDDEDTTGIYETETPDEAVLVFGRDVMGGEQVTDEYHPVINGVFDCGTIAPVVCEEWGPVEFKQLNEERADD